jgi:hypothetical protein
VSWKLDDEAGRLIRKTEKGCKGGGCGARKDDGRYLQGGVILRGRLWSWKRRMLVELAATMGHLRVEFLGGRRRKGERERGA